MRQSGNDGYPAAHGNGESFQLNGYGVTARYTQSHLRVSWDNQSELTIRPPGRQITAHVDVLHLPAKVVTLSLKVEVAVPDPGTGRIDLLLAFPPHLEAEVRGLAERLTNDAAAGQPLPGQAHPTNQAPPHQPVSHQPALHQAPQYHLASHQPVPHQAPPPTPPAPPPLPVARFRANLAAWTDDPEWIGLFPSLETARLIATRPAEPSAETGSYP